MATSSQNLIVGDVANTGSVKASPMEEEASEGEERWVPARFVRRKKKAQQTEMDGVCTMRNAEKRKGTRRSGRVPEEEGAWEGTSKKLGVRIVKAEELPKRNRRDAERRATGKWSGRSKAAVLGSARKKQRVVRAMKKREEEGGVWRDEREFIGEREEKKREEEEEDRKRREGEELTRKMEEARKKRRDERERKRRRHERERREKREEDRPRSAVVVVATTNERTPAKRTPAMNLESEVWREEAREQRERRKRGVRRYREIEKEVVVKAEEVEMVDLTGENEAPQTAAMAIGVIIDDSGEGSSKAFATGERSPGKTALQLIDGLEETLKQGDEKTPGKLAEILEEAAHLCRERERRLEEAKGRKRSKSEKEDRKSRERQVRSERNKK